MKVALYNIINNIEQDELDAGRLQEVYDIDVELGKKVSLPDSFNTEIRKDLVKLAVASARANRRQPYGSNVHGGKKNPMSGMKHSVEWWGKEEVSENHEKNHSEELLKTHTHWRPSCSWTKGGERLSRKLNRNERRLARNLLLQRQPMLQWYLEEATNLQKRYHLCPSFWEIMKMEKRST